MNKKKVAVDRNLLFYWQLASGDWHLKKDGRLTILFFLSDISCISLKCNVVCATFYNACSTYESEFCISL